MKSRQHENEDGATRSWDSPDGRLFALSRFVPPQVHDARWIIGALLLISGFLGSLRVIESFDHTVPAWSLRRTVLPGDRIGPTDLVRNRVHVSRGKASAYVGAELPRAEHRVVQHVVRAGELLSRSALGQANDVGTRSVDVTLTGVGAAPEPGTYADMWVARRTGGDRTPAFEKPSRLVEHVVIGRATPHRRVSASGEDELLVGVRVPASSLSDVIDAVNTHAGITLVPIAP